MYIDAPTQTINIEIIGDIYYTFISNILSNAYNLEGSRV